MPLTLPSQSNTNIVVGGVGYYYLQQAKDITGAALATPDTWHKVSKIGPATASRKSLASQQQKVYAQSNAFGEKLLANVALDLSNTTVANQPPDVTMKFNHIESDLKNLQFYDTVRGNFFYMLVPWGSRAGQLVSWVGFVQIEDGGDVTADASKATEIPIVAEVLNNTVSITPNMTGFTDENVGVISPTIAANGGFIWVGV